MRRPARTARSLGLVMLALAACLVVPATAGAKKKGAGTLDITMPVNLPVPNATEGGPFDQAGVLQSTIEAGKQFAGRRIRDVNVTVQTLGTSGTTPAPDMRAKLTAPNGGHLTLFAGLFGPSPSIGPLTLDDESPLSLGIEEPHNATQLYSPWAGTARPNGGKPLSLLDDGPVRGTWTLTLLDTVNPDTSNLVSWRLNVVAGRPFKTK